MVWSRWWAYSKDVVQFEEDGLGVYELGDNSKDTLYYGRGKIKTRLLDHINKKECPMARNYRYELFDTESQCIARESELLGEYKRKQGRLPMYNERIG